MRPLLVGEHNPYGPKPEHALFPWPRGSAGWRLCTRVMGLALRDYLARFDRINLCVGERWALAEARAAAAKVLAESGGRPAIVLCGARVATAFNFPYAPFSLTESGGPDQPPVVVLPHPSGRCLVWNEPDSVERARRLLEKVGVL